MWISLGPHHDAVLHQHERVNSWTVCREVVFGNHPQLPHVASSFSGEDRAK